MVDGAFVIFRVLSADHCAFYARVAPLLPEFASHWGIIIQETNTKDAKNDDVWLYHLCLEEGDDGRRSVQLVVDGLVRGDKRLKGGKVDEVGRTRFSIPQITRIGHEIDAFGDYHLLFWNCQMFAKCFLRVISDDSGTTFDQWTSADVTNLFLCALVIPAPLATGLKSTDGLRRAGVLKAEMFKEAGEPDPEDREQLNRYSDSAIASLSDAEVMRAIGVEAYRVKDSDEKVGVIKAVVGFIGRLFGSAS